MKHAVHAHTGTLHEPQRLTPPATLTSHLRLMRLVLPYPARGGQERTAGEVRSKDKASSHGTVPSRRGGSSWERRGSAREAKELLVSDKRRVTATGEKTPIRGTQRGGSHEHALAATNEPNSPALQAGTIAEGLPHPLHQELSCPPARSDGATSREDKRHLAALAEPYRRAGISTASSELPAPTSHRRSTSLGDPESPRQETSGPIDELVGASQDPGPSHRRHQSPTGED